MPGPNHLYVVKDNIIVEEFNDICIDEQNPDHYQSQWVKKKRLKNLVAKLLLSSAKFFSLSNSVSSKSLRIGQRSSEMLNQFQLMKALKYLWYIKTLTVKKIQVMMACPHWKQTQTD
ncbi:unnamed protein product [Brassica oleracea]|uniref:Uncharacterized protein n=1 Tax=Brassica oleracea TaxID=3712 RepID=A0A3P6C8I7_BRAOL|nr:unnamed protein product [Brassica oleracea]